MTSVSIDRKIAQDLVESKIKQINEEISEILKRWNQNSAVKMIELTRKGKLEEAEVDAIALTNLIEKRKELEQLLKEVGG